MCRGTAPVLERFPLIRGSRGEHRSNTIVCTTMDRPSVTMDPELRQAAAKDGTRQSSRVGVLALCAAAVGASHHQRGCGRSGRRDGTRQAILARTLHGVQVEDLKPAAGRRIGELLTRSSTSDVVDAHLTTLILPGDTVLTSDEADIRHLLEARRIFDVRIEVVRSGAVGQHPGVVAPSRG